MTETPANKTPEQNPEQTHDKSLDLNLQKIAATNKMLSPDEDRLIAEQNVDEAFSVLDKRFPKTHRQLNGIGNAFREIFLFLAYFKRLVTCQGNQIRHNRRDIDLLKEEIESLKKERRS